MGSSFFQGIDPAGQLIGRFAGNNSWIAKEASYDPIMSSSVGKFISPAMYKAGQGYANRHTVTSDPTPFAGVQPTLQDANAGYVQAAQKAAQQQPAFQQKQPMPIGRYPQQQQQVY